MSKQSYTVTFTGKDGYEYFLDVLYKEKETAILLRYSEDEGYILVWEGTAKDATGIRDTYMSGGMYD